MTTSELLDAAGRRRSPASMPGHHRRRPPRNKGLRYPPDPPAVEEIVAVVRCAGESSFGLRTRALIVVLWRAGLRTSEALALAESDLDLDRGALLVRRGKGGRRRGVGMDAWACQHLQHWLDVPVELPVGALLCIISGRTAGRSCRAGRPLLPASARRPGRGPAPLRTAPAPARRRRRDGARGLGARRDPAPARPHRPRRDLDLPAGHRQQRDHRDRSRPARADTAGERRPSVAARHLAAPVTPPLAREGGHAPPVVPEPRDRGSASAPMPGCGSSEGSHRSDAPQRGSGSDGAVECGPCRVDG
jgi:integrase